MDNQKIEKIKKKDDIWAIRGISHEVKNAAKLAAKKSKSSLGAWLSRKIIEAAQVELTKKSRPVARKEDVLDILSDLSDKFDKDFSALRNQIHSMQTQKKSWLQTLFNKSTKS